MTDDIASSQPPVLLEVDSLTMRFGGLVAVDSVSMAARERRITAVIGPNGAGKTTLFNCITGFYRPASGHIVCHAGGGGSGSMRLEKLAAHDIVRRARVARTFQHIRLFGGMTALENLLVAQHNHLMRQSVFSIAGLLGLPKYRNAERAAVAVAREWLERVGILADADRVAGELSYGAQRRLEIARAMCTSPRLLCLDEPAAGLNPRESAALGELLMGIRAEGLCAVLLIEHDMSVVMGISDYIVVLDYGRKIAEGTPAEIRANPDVIRAYLGEDHGEAA
ncbi:MAG: ATP-binding cassette domain-containing protein [Alphaproteobacteria bacterium]